VARPSHRLDGRCDFYSLDDRRTLAPESGSLSSVGGLVEVNGFEPMTSCLQSRRSPN
jgi:hypothetical protein